MKTTLAANIVDEAEGGELADEALVGAGLGGEVVVLEPPGGGQGCPVEAGGELAGLGGGGLGAHEPLEGVQDGQPAVAGVVEQAGQGLDGGVQLEVGEVAAEPLVGGRGAVRGGRDGHAGSPFPVVSACRRGRPAGRPGRPAVSGAAGCGGAAAVPGGRGGGKPVGEGAALGALGVQGGLGALRALGGGAGQGAGRFGLVLAGGPNGVEFPGVLLACGFQRGGGLRRGAGGGVALACGGIACGLGVRGARDGGTASWRARPADRACSSRACASAARALASAASAVSHAAPAASADSAACASATAARASARRRAASASATAAATRSGSASATCPAACAASRPASASSWPRRASAGPGPSAAGGGSTAAGVPRSAL